MRYVQEEEPKNPKIGDRWEDKKPIKYGIKDLNDINTKTKEGKLLMACLTRLTTEVDTDLTPDECIANTNNLLNHMDFKSK